MSNHFNNIYKEIAFDGKSDGESSTDSFGSNNEENITSVDNDFVKKETRTIHRYRILYILVLLTFGAAVSTSIYFLSQDYENEQVESNYDTSSTMILNAFEEIVSNKLVTITSFTSSMTSYALENKKSWPFVTIASFPNKGAIVRSLTGALVIGTNPMIDTNESIRAEWENYIVGNESSWIQESFNYQADLYPDALEFRDPAASLNIYQSSYPIQQSTFPSKRDPGPGPYLVIHQTSPFIPGLMNVNQRSTEIGNEAMFAMNSKSILIGKPITLEEDKGQQRQWIDFAMSIAANISQEYIGDPMSYVYVPYFDSLNQDRIVVGFVSILIQWASYFENILSQNHNQLVVVLKNTCTGNVTYLIDGSNVTYIGVGDLHDKSFDHMKKTTTFKNQTVIPDGTKNGLPLNQDVCPFSITTYPSNDSNSNNPIFVTCAIAIVFVFIVLMFYFYDRLVGRRHAIVLDRAQQTAAIVSSLFPKSVADRLLQHEVIQSNNRNKKNAAFMRQSGSNKLKSFLNNADSDMIGQEPIADLFLDTTVMFADIAGFTAWSSTREPVQVFVLLQTLYQGFDEIAHRRKVFKVETIGDSYVAVTGLPEKQQHHALIMARFAGDCLQRTYEIFNELESRLGPDTTELGMRFGMHSGPVTGGVIRGDKARFQLFGDTVNTAARMESTGIRNRIHISENSATLISAFGKTHWVKLREDQVIAKGKGIMKTYWLNPTVRRASSAISSDGCNHHPTITFHNLTSTDAKQGRLVNWVCELLLEPLKKIIALRNFKGGSQTYGDAKYYQNNGSVPIDEIAEVIVLPNFNARISAERANYKNIVLREEIMDQLKSYVTSIAATYRDNPFHNFEHACHVTMSVSKLMNRIVAPDIDTNDMNRAESQLHDYTYGITSDPLAVLAIIFSALIHDTDHRGVSNMQLCKEDPILADVYKKQSVAEQNSLDIAWRILMDDQYAKLRGCLFNNQSDMDHFRQVMVNVVLATDIFDKELNDLRKNRWNKAFHGDSISKADLISLRGTIVIEHIIQASDVSHTMQHWHVYQKWNRRLFSEMRRAFNEGRMGADPATFWYQGEIGFFDNYIIPLAKKLKECRVFGVSSDEYLNYAMQNRAEWAERGQEIVAELMIEHPLYQEDEEDILQGKKESIVDTKGLLSKKESIIEIKGPLLFSVDVGDKNNNTVDTLLGSVNARDEKDDHDMGDKSERSESNYSL